MIDLSSNQIYPLWVFDELATVRQYGAIAMSFHAENMHRLLSIAFFLFAFAVLPLQVWASGPMPSGIDSANQMPASMMAAHCAQAPNNHRLNDTAVNHHHDFCCQASLVGLFGTALGPVPIMSPQDSRHEARYTSFEPDALSPPPRA
ncbi:hypothetical protein [Paludibacterium purpuratum]|uniref:DUF2946 family protein n=1 Tax=Paludibacterium purpuratum TaxID=1144873 RepID=A0A4R7B7K5_9NEIS|nr:hypothetical protein [Paludibacterium purpuratum]TDR80691.1 hypothetical protein DFP86_104191 [Paludibacterium purpuratum]